jgi:RHS repeat-associated protein
MYEQGTTVASRVCKDVWLPTSEMVYMDSTGRRMVSPVVTGPDGNEEDTLQMRCIEIDFPGKAANLRRLLRQNSVAGPITWMGSLPQDNQHASGLMYRRNRFYDPRSGRFTQEDPIGLAGGVNSYGFAEGDPVSYRDPYGLSSDTVFYDTPEVRKEVAEAAAHSPEIAATIDLLNHDRHVTVQVRNSAPEALGRENPGRTTATYLANGDVNIEVLFDFTRVDVMNAIPKYRDNGGVTRDVVVGHEFVGHALPFSMHWRCLDDGCAQERENSLVRPDLGLPQRTF